MVNPAAWSPAYHSLQGPDFAHFLRFPQESMISMIQMILRYMDWARLLHYNTLKNSEFSIYNATRCCANRDVVC